MKADGGFVWPALGKSPEAEVQQLGDEIRAVVHVAEVQVLVDDDHVCVLRGRGGPESLAPGKRRSFAPLQGGP